MPIQTRCPSCGAAVPVAASWCSLCHADLRPRAAAPSATASSVLPGAPAPVTPPAAVPGTPVGAVTALGPDATARVGTTITDALRAEASLDARAVGRHSRERTATAPAPEPRMGRAALRAAREAGLAPVAEVRLPTADDATREEVDAIAEQMLSRLAVSEPRSRMLNPEELPGGKWAFMGAGAGIILVLFLVVSVVITLITNR